MTSSRRSPFSLPAAAVLFASVALVRQAHAGTLHVRDEAHVLSADDVSRLRSVVAAAPFDARVAFTSEYPDAKELGRYVSSITEAGMVAVAVDPQHHQVQVHFGTGSRVARSEWPAIEHAGNDAFRRGDWEGGAAAIFRAAAGSAGAATTDAPAPGVAKPSLFGPGLLLLVVGGAIGLAIYFARRRSAYGPAGPYGTMGGTPGYGAGPFPGYPGPAQGGLGPMGGGLIGAGLGGIAGYELGKIAGEREERDRDRGGDIGGSGDDRGGSADEGGGGSSWDDGSSDGGGFDGGGGGDDGGGGSDFGA
ncbi:MAG TPA: hypothetical protein VN894_03535 [Polyangiaceae bacterium]|nr:hypothetical protein [Polyangiaceae bacterium]